MQVYHITQKVLLPLSRCQDTVTKHAHNLWTNMGLYTVYQIKKLLTETKKPTILDASKKTSNSNSKAAIYTYHKSSSFCII
jgi:hypothetical protein